MGTEPKKCSKWEKHQSPIFIDTDCLKELNVPPLKFCKHWEPTGPFIASVKGNTVEVKAPDGCGLSVEGGPLKCRYLLDNLHFHWGECDDWGTEHVIDQTKYAIEAHMVYRNEQYPSVKEAIGKQDGLCVLSLLLESRAEGHGGDVGKLVNCAVEGKPMPSAALAPLKDTLESNEYFTYEGSLTTEPFAEYVTWIIFSRTSLIPPCLVRKLRKVKDVEGQQVCSNCRPLQPLHGRTVSVVGARNKDTQDPNPASSQKPCTSSYRWSDYVILACQKLSKVENTVKAFVKELTKCRND